MRGLDGPEGFEELYRDQWLALVRLGYLMCGSKDLAEDLVQTAFASAQPRWHAIDNHVAYLKRAVLNRSLFGSQTWVVVQRMPWRRRAVVVLHYYEDLPLVEVARILDRPDATVRSDHRRALDWLREELAHDKD